MLPAKLAAILLAGGLAGAAWAQLPMHSPPLGTSSPPVAPYSGPGDLVAALAWVGLRPYSLAKVGTKAVNLVRASDSHTCDFLSSATLGLGNSAGCSNSGENGTALATWCNATTCSVTKLYDQTGGTNCSAAVCDVSQATGAKQPTVTLSCLGSLPCLTFVRASNQILTNAAGAAGAANGPAFTSAAERTGNTTSFHEYFGSGHSELLFKNAVNAAGVYGGTGVFGTANDSVWHAIQGWATVTANATYTYIDGTKTTGTDSNNLTQTGLSLGCFNSSTTDCLDGKFAEGGIFDGQSATGWTNTQLSNMNSNIHNFWGF